MKKQKEILTPVYWVRPSDGKEYEFTIKAIYHPSQSASFGSGNDSDGCPEDWEVLEILDEWQINIMSTFSTEEIEAMAADSLETFKNTWT